MKDRIPYCYLLTFIPTGQLYCGIRFAKNCHPTDFWKKYFTSSDIIHKLIKNYGIDCFTYEILSTFSSKEDALRYEYEYLINHDAVKSEKFFNKCYGRGSGIFSHDNKVLIFKEIDGKISAHWHNKDYEIPNGWTIGRGTPSWNNGISMGPCTNERRNNISNARINTEKIQCPYCNEFFDPGNFLQFHGNNCLMNPNVNNSILEKRSLRAKESMKKQKETGTWYKFTYTENDCICQYCYKICGNPGARGIHESRCELNPNRKLFYCQFCNKEFSMLRVKNDHEKSCELNPNRKLFYCQFCNKEFNLLQAKTQHEKKCLANPNQEIKELYCRFCGKTYKDNGNLSKHEKKCRLNPINFF